MRILRFVPILVVVGIWWSTCQHPFFWDTVQLASRQAQWFYDQGFRSLLLPDAIDSGHPPGFGLYLAWCWSVLGQHLWVSHLAMLPFVGLLTAGLYRLATWIPAPWGYFLPFCLVVDSVFVAQLSLVSPDIVLMAMLVWGLICIQRQQHGGLLLCNLVLVGLSLRGMMAVLLLYGFQISQLPRATRRSLPSWFRLLPPYLPAGVLALSFLLYHSVGKAWVGFHAASPWRESFNLVDFSGLMRNAVVLVWRLLDFGRLAEVLGLVVLMTTQRHHLPRSPYWSLLLIALLIQVPHFLIFQGVSAHRYLMPVFLAVHLVVLDHLSTANWSLRAKAWCLSLVLAGLFSGQYWLYPAGIAQGWDSTPKHWAHFTLRRELLVYLQQQAIPLAKVGTVFPEIGPLHWRELNGRTDGFSPLDWEKNEYIYYSSVMNAFTDQDRERLFSSWNPVLQLEDRGLQTILFKKP